MRKLIHITLFLYIFTSCAHTKREPASQAVISNNASCMSIIEAIASDHSYRRKKIIYKNILKIDQGIKSLMYDLDWYKSFEIGDIHSYVKNNNEIIDAIAKILKKSKIDVKIKSGLVKDGEQNISYKFLALENLTASKSSALKKIGRHLKKSNVKNLEIDIFGNAFNGRGGYFSSSKSKMSLSRNVILQIFKEDLPGYVFKHEASHAYFKKQRITNPESIYHSSYRSIKGAEIYDQGIYRKYMSLEELYNYANNLFWSLDNVKSKNFINKKGSVETSFKLFKTLLEQLDNTTKQTISMSTKSHEAFTRLIDSPISVYETTWGHIKNQNSIGAAIEENIYSIRLAQKEDKSLLETAKRLENFIKENNIPTFVDNKQWTEDLVPQQFKEEFFSMYHEVHLGEKKLFKRFMEQDQQIIELSKNLKTESENMKRALEALESKYQFYLNAELSKEEMNLALVDFRQRARKLGLMVRGL